MKERVIAIVGKVLNAPPGSITEKSSPDTVENWDSLAHMNIVLALEQEFGIQFDDEQLLEMLNVGLIVDTVQECLDNR